MIYEQQPEFQRGEAVAWIELLSPTNKGSDRDAPTYLAKRRLLLENGLVFVEIDFLHETPPTFPRLLDYTRKHPDSFPYRIVVLDPRPDFKTGSTHVHEFRVGQPIPGVDIPLNGSDVLTFDFGMPYQKVFEDSIYGDDVDYSQLPMNFDRYMPGDQLNILNRMLTVIEAQDLDEGLSLI